MRERGEVRVSWTEEERTMELEGEKVLSYTVRRPRVEGAGAGGRWIGAYYDRLARSWKRRWEREAYIAACLDLAESRAERRSFTPWEGGLGGEVTVLRDGVLSLRFSGWERRGESGINRVSWGDVWKVREGAPLRLKEAFGGRRRWRAGMWRDAVRRGEELRRSGACFLDEDWAEKAKWSGLTRGYCLTEDGVELTLPQCLAAPAAEGCPVIGVRTEGGWGPHTQPAPGKAAHPRPARGSISCAEHT